MYNLLTLPMHHQGSVNASNQTKSVTIPFFHKLFKKVETNVFQKQLISSKTQ